MKTSKYAAAIRAAYEHPDLGPQVFRISPDTDPRAPAAVKPGSDGERPFKEIWYAAPQDLCCWACGRLAADEPAAAAEMLEEVPHNGMWDIGALGRRGNFLRVADGAVVGYHGPLDQYRLDKVGNVVDAETGELVDLA